MPSLFSYVLRIDDGAAPNPFWGVCTLAICKPAIRRTAEVDDWIVGTGSKRAPDGRDLSGTMVYAMRVTTKLTMAEYDAHCLAHLPKKVPGGSDWRARLGDSIFDFSKKPPRLREGVHAEDNRRRDLSGKFVLLSKDFIYVGNEPIPLPSHLRALAHQQQGHRSRLNDPLLAPFVSWVRSLRLRWNVPLARPQALDEESCSAGSCRPSC